MPMTDRLKTPQQAVMGQRGKHNYWSQMFLADRYTIKEVVYYKSDYF
jgi:hypothetical protein